METLNIIYDFVLIIASAWMVYTVRKLQLGGIIGTALNLITIGAIILGLAHLAETLSFEFWGTDDNVATLEFVHRTIVFVGFVLLTLGFRGMRELHD